ncbi:MAG: dUTP diphosphatase [Ruminococcaceae bacterium]|nr:dUTP diphosphatase [Oscillospiraceae bacterium]
MNEINVKIKLVREGAVLPAYATDGSAAIDLRSAAEDDIIIAPGERKLIPTGIAIAPETCGAVAILCARSGLSTKFGITLANGIGVIDSDYRGEIQASLYNRSDVPYTVVPGDRIAQLMFIPVLHANLIPSDELDETVRGAGGFGSTGRN